jgi:hypothetical protein
MLLVESALKGYSVEASDGSIGKIIDCLFDDRTWKLRWLVIDTRAWLFGRKVLIHPSSVGLPDADNLRLPVHLTKGQIEASPGIGFDLPISEQVESGTYGHYGWDPAWRSGGYFAGFQEPAFGEAEVLERPGQAQPDGGDPNLRSMATVTGYHVQATDGTIGHVENFIIDDVLWDIHYLIVDTKNWWIGQHVLISPFAVTDICREDEDVQLNVSKDTVRKSPPWRPLDLVKQSDQALLHAHYGWPNHGW